MNVSAELQLVVTVLLVPLVGWLWREGHGRLKALEEAQRSAERALAEFKLMVATEYASRDHLRDVEARFLADLGEIKETLKDIAKELRRTRLGAAE